jgi:RNA polymerase sigma-70 factor (ECF subfamily)
MNARLFGIAQRIIRDYHRAEDATQQALVEIWRDLPKLRDPDRFEAWTYRVLVHVCYAEARRARGALPERDLLETDSHGTDAALGVVERDMLERAFRRIPVDQRAVLVLHYYLDLDHQEIADLLGVPVGTVKSRAFGGRSAMRAALEADARPGVRWGTT